MARLYRQLIGATASFRKALSFSKTGPALILMASLLMGPKTQAQQPTDGKAATGQETTSAPNAEPRKYLFGDWGGERNRLEDKGVVFDVFYVVDALSNVNGGMQQANTAWGRIRGTTKIDLEKLAQLHGTSFYATGVWQYGANLGVQYIGSLANPSSLVSAHTFRLDSWWLQQKVLDGKLTFRAGQFAGQDFYGVREYGGSYLYEPMGYAFGNLFGTVYESYDPPSTPAADVKIAPTKNIYLKTAILSGNRDPFNQDTTGFHFAIKDSPVWASEAGYLVNPPSDSVSAASPLEPVSYKSNLPGIYKFGSAYNAGKFTDPLTGVRSGGNYLIYLEADQAVYRRGTIGKDAKRGLDLTFGYDWSPSDVNRLNTQLTAGARYTGLFPKRDLDELSLGIVHSQISSHFNTPASGTTPAQTYGSEQLIELTYKSQLTPWLIFQPDFQYTVNPGALQNSSRGNATVLGFRTKVTF